VDAAARIKAPFAAPSKLREALPPLASNDLFGGGRYDMPISLVRVTTHRPRDSTTRFENEYPFKAPAIHSVRTLARREPLASRSVTAKITDHFPVPRSL